MTHPILRVPWCALAVLLLGSAQLCAADDPAPGEASDTESDIEPDTSGRDGLDLDEIIVTQAHDGALSKLALD